MKAKDWIAPGIIIAVMTLWLAIAGGRFTSLDGQYTDIGKRLTDLDAKSDRRIDGLGSRFDAVLQQQSALAAQIGSVQAELAYIKGRLDKVADKLQVTTVVPSAAPTTYDAKTPPRGGSSGTGEVSPAGAGRGGGGATIGPAR